MMQIEVTSETGQQVTRLVSRDDLVRLSGVELAALLFLEPTEVDIKTLNEFLAHYQDGAA